MVRRQYKKGSGGVLKNELHNTKTIAREQGLFLLVWEGVGGEEEEWGK